MGRINWLICYTFLHISFLSIAQNVEIGNYIKFGGIDFPLSVGYKVNSDLFLEQERLVLDKVKGIGLSSTIESSIVITSKDNCGEICNKNFNSNEFLKVLEECSHGDFTSRSLVMSLDGIDTLTGVIFIENKSIGITNNENLFNQWSNMVCLKNKKGHP